MCIGHGETQLSNQRVSYLSLCHPGGVLGTPWEYIEFSGYDMGWKWKDPDLHALSNRI